MKREGDHMQPKLGVFSDRWTVPDQRNQHSRPDRTDPRNLAQQFPRFVLLAFHQQIPPHLLAQEPQDIQLLVVVFGSSPDAGFTDLAEPF